MTHNDVLRQLRYAFDYYDSTIVNIFALGGHTLFVEEATHLLLKEDDPDFLACATPEFDCFLNGLIIHRRGLQKGRPAPVKNPYVVLTNNDILKKLRIALELREEDMLAIIHMGGMEISKHELSALFRKPGHKHFKECGEQFMRLFLRGLTRWTKSNKE